MSATCKSTILSLPVDKASMYVRCSPVRPQTRPEEDPVAQIADERFFAFEVTNDTDQIVSVAVVSLQAPDGSDWVVTGWFNIQPRSTGPVGKFVKGDFYATPKNGSGARWAGRDYSTYVNVSQAFARTIDGSYRGKRDEEIAGFYKFSVMGPVHRWRLGT